MAHWADRHLPTEGPKRLDPRQLEQPKRSGVPALAITVALLAAACGGAAYWFLTPRDELAPVVTDPAPGIRGGYVAVVDERPGVPVGSMGAPVPAEVRESPAAAPAPEPSSVAPEPVGAVGAPAKPGPTVDRAAIERGIAVLERQEREHQAVLAGLETTLREAMEPKYPRPGGDTFDRYARDQANAARERQDMTAAVRWENALGDYNRKLNEYRTKIAHEREVLASLARRKAAEQAKLPPN